MKRMRGEAGKGRIKQQRGVALEIVAGKRPFLVLLSAWLWVLALGGCGYHLRATGSPMGTVSMESLAIPMMTSTSSSLGFEGDFTRVIREEFMHHSKVPLVSRESASSVLVGNVYEIKTEPLSYTLDRNIVQGQVTTYEVTRTRRLRIKLAAKLMDETTGKVIWEDGALEEKATYVVSDDPLTTRHNERKAVREIAQRLAKRIYLKTMERF